MFVLQFLACLLLAVATRGSVPENYILDVSHSCGTRSAAGDPHDASGANVTIKSDLQVRAQVLCNNGRVVQLNPINDTNTETTLELCYTADTTGTCDAGTSCYFTTPSAGSNLYTVELNVFWGFTNGTLMNEYETYTITCTTHGDGSNTLANKDISEDYIPVKNEVVHSLGDGYAGTSSLKLIDILGDEITSSSVPMSKKVQLQVEVENDDYLGVTPYDCEAKSKDGYSEYRFLMAGCGDGAIIPKDEGFNTVGNVSTSPFFKTFKLIEADSLDGGISYECSFVVCNASCDGSSCSMRSKRSLPEDIPEQQRVRTPTYSIRRIEERVEDRLDQSKQQMSDLKLDTRLKLASIEIIGIGAVALLSLVIALYSCVRVERKRISQKVSSKLSSA